MKQYQDLIRKILFEGVTKTDRTGTGTKSIFATQMRFDLKQGFPLVTTKKLHTKSIIHELLWFLRGDTNVKYLNDNGVRIWNEWADENGELGPVYGAQWRRWKTGKPRGWEGERQEIDQIQKLVDGIMANPDGRRHIVNSWNVGEIDKMKLPPCHLLFQMYVANGKLSCQLYQRSTDVFLGLPFNIASYALLTHMIAQVCGLEVGEFVHVSGDTHIYSNHIEQAWVLVDRDPRPLPHLELTPRQRLENFVYEDFKIVGYDPHPAIKAAVAV